MNMYCLVLIMVFLITPLVQADDIEKCAPDYDISRIRNIPLDENAKYVFNETEIIVNAPIESVFHFIMNEPVENQVTGTDSIPGVRSTRPIKGINIRQEGFLRIICLDDGSTAVEKILKNIPDKYFSYQVWDYAIKCGDNIEYALGEFWFTPEGSKTHIRWRYSFKLNKKKFLGRTGPLGRQLAKIFLRTRYNELMNVTLNNIKKGAEEKSKNIEAQVSLRHRPQI